MGLSMPSFADDVEDGVDNYLPVAMNPTETPETLRQTRKDWLAIIKILGRYQTRLTSIVVHHADLTPEYQERLLKQLFDRVQTHLTAAETLLFGQPSTAQDFLAISHEVGSAKVVLLMIGAELEMHETGCWFSLESAFARLRRTEAFYTCMKQLRAYKASHVMQKWGDHTSMDILESTIRRTQPNKLVDVEELSGQTMKDHPDGIACAICDETAEKTMEEHCPVMVLPCCLVAVHGCCMASRLQEEDYTFCPDCLEVWSDETMAACLHMRTYQLEQQLRSHDVEACERVRNRTT